MGYFGELFSKWRPLLAALLGLASGIGITQFSTSIIVPLVVKEFHWSNAEFAPIGGLSIFAIILFPFIGRLTDVIGSRWTALIGVICMPLSFFLLSRMDGSLNTYTYIFLFQASICLTTTFTVYSRVVVQQIKNARGLALGFIASGPAIMGLIGTDFLNRFAESQGWRSAYVLMAVYCAIGGLAALLLMPSETRNVDPATRPARRSALKDYPLIMRSRAFWVLIVAMLLVNCAQVLALQQMKFVLTDNGIRAADVGGVLTFLPAGMLLGRLVSGFLLDRVFSAKLVAVVGMSLPAIGLLLMGSNWDDYWVLTAAVFMIGIATGAEGDVVAFLVARNFGVTVYGSVFGLLTLSISLSSSAGQLIYGKMLAATGDYKLFLYSSAVAVFLGALSFLLLPRQPSPLERTGADAKADATPATA